MLEPNPAARIERQRQHIPVPGMKLFRCDHCSNVIYFENIACENCGHRLGYLPTINSMVSLEPDGDLWRSALHPGEAYVFCLNAQHGACNWLVPYNPGGDPFCRACDHNEMVPNLEDPQNLGRWQTIERAKKRLFYSLLQFRLPLATRAADPVHGLSFRFLSEAQALQPILTGHENGIITLALAEADDAEREYRRTLMHEPYRTLLGHFRHEIAHYYWDTLIRDFPQVDEFRALFGDERQDYLSSLNRHYAEGAPSGWQSNYISAYASSHPWEDFAETWAHYFHIADTVEMATAFGVSVDPRADRTGELTAEITFDPYRPGPIRQLIDNWIPLASLLNNLNRAVGQNDAYPFVLTAPVIQKLGFVRAVIAGAGHR
jgi:hypothetical protein